VDEDMDEPVYFYYEMRNFYQNHIVFVKSRDYPQLRGKKRSENDLVNCGSFTTMDDMLSEDELKALNYTGDETASPCGLAAKYYPNESFSLLRPNGDPIQLKHSAIAWGADIDYVYLEADDDRPWLDVEEGED
jgi:hypothetical protein